MAISVLVGSYLVQIIKIDIYVISFSVCYLL